MKISFATIQDTKRIMDFLGEYWKKDHILSKNKELFLYEFQEENRLNFAIAKDEDGTILGLFGFIKYNSLVVSDLAGSLWKVRDDCKIPILGLKLREFTIKNIPHRFFAAPGAGIKTKPIYQIIKMDWNKMMQYFVPNDTMKEYHILKLNDSLKKYSINKKVENKNIKISKIVDIDELKDFDFNKYKNIVPFKDFQYIKKRFIGYPIYSYDIYKVEKENEIMNIFICRTVKYNSSKVYRIVDFYGDEDYMKNITNFLYRFIVTNGYEYYDFVCHGFDENKLLNAGFNKLDFESEIIVPNFFEPFVQKNVPVYCVSDKIEDIEMIFRQCKADGDQDRPNVPRENNG